MARAAVVAALVVLACMLAFCSGWIRAAGVEPVEARVSEAPVQALTAAPEQPRIDVPPDGPATERVPATTNVRPCRVRVTTVDGRGQPIAGAEVRYVAPRAPGAPEREVRLHEELGDVEAALRRVGLLAITDANGVVEIEGHGGSLVCARSGDLYAQDSLGYCDQPGADQLRLELLRDVTFRVEVVDANGRPLPGRTLEVVAYGVSVRYGQVNGSLTLWPTDANGVAVRTHLLHEVGCGDNLIDGHVVVALERRVRGRPRERVAMCEVPWHELRAVTDVRLVVRVGGALVVRVLDADGCEIKWVHGLLQDEQSTDGVVLEPVCGPDDRMQFEGLPLGRRWRLTIDPACLGHLTTVVGPVTVADMVAVDLTLPARCFDLAARIVRSDQLPVEGAQVVFRGAGLPPSGPAFTADWRGRLRTFRWLLPAAIERIGSLEIAIRGDHCAPRTLVVDRTIEPGETDLGDIVVEPPAVETVLARIELRCEGKAVTRPQAELGVREGKTWSRVQALVRHEAGEFEFLGRLPPPSMLVACRAHGCMPVELPVQPGEHKVVDLQRAATLEVPLLAPEIPCSTFTGIVVRDGEQREIHGSLYDTRQELWFHELLPGCYRLRIAIEGRVVHEAERIELHAGHNRWPMDGSRIDLRGHRGWRIVARSAATGERVFVSALQVSPRAEELPPGPELQDDTFVPTEPLSDLLVRADGYVPVRVTAAANDVSLQLQPSTEVEVAAPGDGDAAIRMCIVDDPVRDPLLRAFDKHHEHATERLLPSEARLRFVPGTVVEFTVLRDGKPGVAERVVIGTASPQVVTLR